MSLLYSISGMALGVWHVTQPVILLMSKNKPAGSTFNSAGFSLHTFVFQCEILAKTVVVKHFVFDMYSGMHTSTLLEPSFFFYSRDRNPPLQFECPLCRMLYKQLERQYVCHWLKNQFPLSKYKNSAHLFSSMGVVSLKAQIPSVSLACYSFTCAYCQDSSRLFPGMGRMGLRSIRQKSYWELLVVPHLANLSISMLVMRRLSGLRPLEQLSSLSRSSEASVPFAWLFEWPERYDENLQETLIHNSVKDQGCNVTALLFCHYFL